MLWAALKISCVTKLMVLSIFSGSGQDEKSCENGLDCPSNKPYGSVAGVERFA